MTETAYYVHGHRKDCFQGRAKVDFSNAAKDIFPRGAKSGKISFYLLESKKTTFLGKKLIGKYYISILRGSKTPLPSPTFDTHDYVHIMLALRVPRATASYSSRIFAFYVQSLTVAGISQPRSDVARKIRISQGPQSY